MEFLDPRLCYDDHNGTDLTPRTPYTTGSWTVRAAAGGGVVAVCALGTGCTSSYPASHAFPFESCYGNYVIVDHENGYFTRYGHMNRITSSPSMSIPGGTAIGEMGNTSACGTSTGTHLHFGVFCDDGNGRWDGEEIDRPVDPFGWNGRLMTPGVSDPWVESGGPVSSRLWIYPERNYCSLSDVLPSYCTDQTSTIRAQVPPSTFASGTQLIVSRSPTSSPPAQMFGAGTSFWLRIGSQTGNDAPTINNKTTALPQPIVLEVNWDAAATRHLNMSQTVLYARAEGSEIWQTLATTADQGSRIAQAQTMELGDFDLRAPLLCPSGDVEPNDAYSQAWATVSGAVPANGVFDISEDEDWYRVDMSAARSYTLQTSALGAGVDTILELYDTDGVTRLATDDNGGGGAASRLEWTPGSSGTYFVRVARTASGAYGCSASYSLDVTSEANGQRLFLPLILR